MFYNFQFFHKNGKPYPVSNTDNIVVEITHNGSAVTKTMSLGGVGEDDINIARVAFTVHKSGEYHIRVMFSARHIKGSPFTKTFEAGEFVSNLRLFLCPCIDTSGSEIQFDVLSKFLLD